MTILARVLRFSPYVEVVKMYKKVLLVCFVAAAASYGEKYELKWDTGTFGYAFTYPCGYDAWFANDFHDRGYD